MEKENTTQLRSPDVLISAINTYGVVMLTEVSCYLSYDSWKLTKEGLKDYQQDLINELFNGKLITKEELNIFTIDQLKKIGLRKWSDETDEVLWLLPLSLVPLLDPELEVTAIDDAVTKLKDVDLDIRYGFIAHGITRPK